MKITSDEFNYIGTEPRKNFNIYEKEISKQEKNHYSEKIKNLIESTEKIDAEEMYYKQLQGLLSEFEQSSDDMRQSPSIDYEASVFDNREVILTSGNNNVNAGYYLTANSVRHIDGDSMLNTKHTISNIVMATAKIQSAQNFPSDDKTIVSSSGDGIFTPGVFQINSSNITLNEGDSLRKIRDKINFLSNKTNVSAQITKISSSNFQLILTSTMPGTANIFTITDNDNIFINSNNVTWSTIDASDASLTYKFNNQVNIVTKPSNKITDLIPGIVLTLNNNTVDSNSSIDLEIKSDIDKVIDAISKYVDNFNNIISFFQKKQAFGNEFSEIKRQLIDCVYSLIEGLDENFSHISSIGINGLTKEKAEAQNKNINLLEIDHEELKRNLLSNFENCRKIFETRFSSDNSNFLILGSNMNIKKFSIDFNNNRSSIVPGQYSIINEYKEEQEVQLTQAAIVNYESPSGKNLSTYFYCHNLDQTTTEFMGLKGTIFEGLKIFYDLPTSNNTIDFANIQVSVGVAEKTYKYTKDIKEILQNNLELLSDKLLKLEVKIKNSQEMERKNLENKKKSEIRSEQATAKHKNDQIYLTELSKAQYADKR